jgi:hypothetical protein
MARSTDWVPDDAWIEFVGWVGPGVLRAVEKSYDVALRQSERLFLGNAQVRFGSFASLSVCFWRHQFPRDCSFGSGVQLLSGLTSLARERSLLHAWVDGRHADDADAGLDGHRERPGSPTGVCFIEVCSN